MYYTQEHGRQDPHANWKAKSWIQHSYVSCIVSMGDELLTRIQLVILKESRRCLIPSIEIRVLAHS